MGRQVCEGGSLPRLSWDHKHTHTVGGGILTHLCVGGTPGVRVYPVCLWDHKHIHTCSRFATMMPEAGPESEQEASRHSRCSMTFRQSNSAYDINVHMGGRMSKKMTDRGVISLQTVSGRDQTMTSRQLFPKPQTGRDWPQVDNTDERVLVVEMQISECPMGANHPCIQYCWKQEQNNPLCVLPARSGPVPLRTACARTARPPEAWHLAG